MKAACYNHFKLKQTIAQMERDFAEHKYLRVTWSVEKARTNPQNAILHAWIEQISRELSEDTPEGVKCEVKLRFGVPILRADEDEFREAYDAAIKPLAYEQKLKAMCFWPVTSLMNVSQLSRMLDDMQRGYDGRVALMFPDDYEHAA